MRALLPLLLLVLLGADATPSGSTAAPAPSGGTVSGSVRAVKNGKVVARKEVYVYLKPLGITWSCTSRVTTDYDTLKAMKEAGCRLLIVGYESGDPQILKNIKKGATVQRALDFTRDCHKLGLVIHGDFILGLPGETKESIRNTIEFAKQLDCETIQVSIAHAFPGTEFFDYAKENGFITNAAMMCRSAITPLPASIRITAAIMILSAIGSRNWPSFDTVPCDRAR